MLDFDLSKVPVEIAKLLMPRGSRKPPLQWQEQRNPLANKVLDEIDDAKLFGGLAIKDEGMGAAVRSLLLLWAGWPGEANMLAQIAGPAERYYIGALCERQLTHSGRAKELFREMDGHPIYKPLGQYTLQAIRPDADEALRRVRDIIKFNEEWEPCAFIDLYEQARAGTLSPTTWHLVGDLQIKEFELLFSYCYQKATGQSIVRRRVISEAEEKKREAEYKRRMAERRKRTQQASRTRSEPEPAKQETDARKPKSKAKILCPQCEHMMFVPESARGKKSKCLKCEAIFLVPTKKQSIRRFITNK